MAVAAEVGETVSGKESTGYGLQATGRKGSRSCSGCSLRTVACCLSLAFPSSSLSATYSLIISGLGGEPAYEQRFREQAATLSAAAQQLTGDELKVITLAGGHAGRDSIRRELRALAAQVTAEDQVIITLIGHGSFDGDEYRFNLPGPDLTATELAALFDQLPAKQQLIVNASSASGATVERWERDDRIVITATRSGGERTATRFPQHWVQALASADADVNKDDIVTAAEAFEFASRKVADSFKSDATLATEHARLAGGNAGSFQVARFGTATRVTSNPELNEMFAQRVRIERDLDVVRQRKSTLPQDAYYDELELTLVRLALLQQQIDAKQSAQE